MAPSAVSVAEPQQAATAEKQNETQGKQLDNTKTFFDNANVVNFADVRTDVQEDGENACQAGIDASGFLDAAETLVALLDLVGGAALSPIRSDILGNVKKLRDRIAGCKTIQGIVLKEASTGASMAKKTAVAADALLWLRRGLDFCCRSLQRSLDTPTEELSDSFGATYTTTLRAHHSFVVRPVVALALKACPRRADFMQRLANGRAENLTRLTEQLHSWLAALARQLEILREFYVQQKYDPAS